MSELPSATQCCAVRTQLALRIEPPQNWNPESEVSATCQGTWSIVVAVPPTISSTLAPTDSSLAAPSVAQPAPRLMTDRLRPSKICDDCTRLIAAPPARERATTLRPPKSGRKVTHEAECPKKNSRGSLHDFTPIPHPDMKRGRVYSEILCKLTYWSPPIITEPYRISRASREWRR